MRGMFVGRFQPFHRGHRAFLADAAGEVEEVVVAVGSAQASHTVENPFTAGERVAMVHRALADLDAAAFVVPVEDVGRYAVPVAHVASRCPPFDVVYSNNPLVERLFEEAGYEVRGVRLYDRDRYRGTAIRRRMLDDGEWRHLVPDAVAAVVDEVGGVRRLKRVAAGDVSAEDGRTGAFGLS